MGFKNASGKEKVVVIFNAVVRLAQFIVAAATIGIYAAQKGYWLDHDLPGRITFELVVGALSLITALAFAIVPFILSYRPVAFGAPWDFILMVLWGAAFGLMKSIFLHRYDEKTRFEVDGDRSQKYFDDRWYTMMRVLYINLAGLILFLISGVMGVILFCIGRRSSRSKASFA